MTKLKVWLRAHSWVFITFPLIAIGICVLWVFFKGRLKENGIPTISEAFNELKQARKDNQRAIDEAVKLVKEHDEELKDIVNDQRTSIVGTLKRLDEAPEAEAERLSKRLGCDVDVLRGSDENS